MITPKDLALTCRDILNKKAISTGELIFLLDGRRKGLVDFVLIDIRSPEGHKNLSINGTDVLFPIAKMHLYPEVLEQLRHEKFVMYCTMGARTQYLQNVMLKMGFSQATILKGGIIAYHGETSHNSIPPNIL